jgi:uncharacterized protein (DUF39 family)
MNNYAVIFMVKVQELLKEYKDIINDCKDKVTTYFGTRNVEDSANFPGIHVNCEILGNDAIELRKMCPNYVELVFIKNNGEIFIVTDL